MSPPTKKLCETRNSTVGGVFRLNERLNGQVTDGPRWVGSPLQFQSLCLGHLSKVCQAEQNLENFDVQQTVNFETEPKGLIFEIKLWHFKSFKSDTLDRLPASETEINATPKKSKETHTWSNGH